MAALPESERIALCLHDLAKFYDAADASVDVHNEFIEAFDISWTGESATGDAQFLPGQFTRFWDVSRRPEGNIHFAGEHLSKHHTWISGALESAHGAVAQVLDKPEKELKPLGKEFAPDMPNNTIERGQLETVTEANYVKFAIPHHMNVQYVEVETG